MSNEEHKYLIIINQEDPSDYTIDDDMEDYDGPEYNHYEDGVYHITADSPEKALEAARHLDMLGNAAYGCV